MRRLQKIFGKSKEKLKHGTLNPGTAPAATGTTPVDGAENSQSQQTHGPDRDDSQAGNIAATPAVNSNEATPTLKSDTKASYGLNPIEPPEVDGERPATDTNFPVDIVAIHGITGGAFTTFTTPKGVFWLQEFLPSDLPGSRIFSFGYDAGVFFTKGEGTLNTFARALLENLRMRRAGPVRLASCFQHRCFTDRFAEREAAAHLYLPQYGRLGCKKGQFSLQPYTSEVSKI